MHLHVGEVSDCSPELLRDLTRAFEEGVKAGGILAQVLPGDFPLESTAKDKLLHYVEEARMHLVNIEIGVLYD